MRGFIFRTALILVTLGFGLNAFAHVSLNNPVGGETFNSGEVVTIVWTELVPHNTQNWDLYFSDDAGATWSALKLDIAYGTNSYAWTVPDMETSEAVVRVVQDNSGMNYEHQCLNFTIMSGAAPPVIVEGAQDMDIACSSADQGDLIQNWLDDNGGASATSSCGNLTWSHNYSDLNEGCGLSGSAAVTFTCTDSCGNSSSSDATITVTDDSPPNIDQPAQNITVECDGTNTPPAFMTWLENNGNASGSDVCSSIEWTNNYNALSNGCGNTGSSVVVFTATDDCGNSSTTQATVTIEDTTPPDVELEAQDITMECSAADQQVNIQAWIAGHGGAMVSDNCGNVTWSNDYTGLSGECGETGSASVTFTITDECGNKSTTSAKLTVEDTKPPVVEKMAQDISVECDDEDRASIIQEWLNNIAGAKATDLCGNVTWTDDYTVPSEDCVGQTTEAVTFTASDLCGNSITTIGNIKNMLSTGVEDLFDGAHLKIYPNPASDVIYIEIAGIERMQKSVALYDASGRLIWQQNDFSNLVSINVDKLSSGIYFLKLTSEENSTTRKIVIN